MKYFFGIIVAFNLSWVPNANACSSTDSLPNLLPLLATLNAAQKELVLDYAHHLGAYYGKPVEKTVQMLNPKNQERVALYIAFLQNPAQHKSTSVHWNFDTLKFAAMEEGMILIDSFVITNTGTEPYFIKEVKASCDCAALSYPKFPVMPGDSASMRIEFDSINKAGRQLPAIVVYDNSRPNRRSILYLEGEVTPKGNVKVIYRN
jgi:hypothetical protein